MDQLFEKRMKELLGGEYEDWLNTLDQPLYQGLRISPGKQDPEITKEQLPVPGRPSPFAENTWYIDEKAGLYPEHLQGLFYLQEPSAGSAVSVLDVQPGETVLDLCAAPGSKSTQILDHIGDGFLLSNEIDPKRAQVLLSNMERMGAENFAITNMDSKTLCAQVSEFFDRVLVDAPCSGEGMMKKHDAARDEWSLPNVLLCAVRQKDILKEAWKTLKPGGTLVYSTCTYAPEENEGNVAWMLETFDDCILDPIDVSWGRPGIAGRYLDHEQAQKVRRIFPMDGGEGHFIARMIKQDRSEEQTESRKKARSIWKKNDELPKAAAAFLEKQLDCAPEEIFCQISVEKKKDSTAVYGMSRPFLNLKKGKVLRQGVQIGELIKNRFEPSHAFYMSIPAARHLSAKKETSLEQMNAFYHGEQLPLKADDGYTALTYHGIPYGYGKSSAGRITNKLPKGLRLLPNSAVHAAIKEEK